MGNNIKYEIPAIGGILYLRNGESIPVIAETTHSLIIPQTRYRGIKVSKSLLRKQGHNGDGDCYASLFISQQDALVHYFADEHRYKISRRVERLEDPRLLKAVADLIGYQPEPGKE